MTEFRELPIGTTLDNGKYIIVKVLGVGGFGITYYAKHKTLHRDYAIKEFFISGRCVRNTQTKKIHLQGITKEAYDEYKQKFIDEAKILAKLKHDNIVKVNNLFEENDTAYMVMSFVEGMTLQSLVKQKGKLNSNIAISYIGDIADAVNYIHNHDPSILHRDIKPDNIIITPNHRAILIDFGSAREFINDKTQSHTIMLTKGYAPPEQYSSNSRKGSYSDIYSLGAVFYFILTAQKPIDSSVRAIETMPRPKDLVHSISENANRAIMKAMSMKPEDRYQNIKKFISDLEDDPPVPPKPLKNRKKILIISLCMIVLLLAGTAAWKFMQQHDNLTITSSLPNISTDGQEPEEESVVSPVEEQQPEVVRNQAQPVREVAVVSSSSETSPASARNTETERLQAIERQRHEEEQRVREAAEEAEDMEEQRRLAQVQEAEAARIQAEQDQQGIVINSIRWATRNVAVPGTFATNPESSGMLYQWNRRTSWAATSENVSDWDGSTPSGTSWTRANDPCPQDWRVPTLSEFQSLVNSGSIWITRNGVGGRLFGTAPNQIFLPAVGFRVSDDGKLDNAGRIGYYWSSMQTGNANARILFFHNNIVMDDSFDRGSGFSVRCIAE
jgi:uncharacterized protein (TIGR02145 family)